MTADIPIEEIAARAVNNTAIMLDALFEAHPLNVKVVMFGYDVLNFDMSEVRTVFANLFLLCR